MYIPEYFRGEESTSIESEILIDKVLSEQKMGIRILHT